MTKIQLRNLWFQIHKWIGLTLAVLIIPISLTGAILVWHEPIEEAMHPERHAVAGPGTLAPIAYADSARGALGRDELLTRLQIPGKAGEPVVASATRAGQGRPQRITLYLDPADAHVIGTERSGEGIFQFFHQLHGSLLIPGAGRPIVGWIGVAMLLSSLTGLWLWWPVTGSVRRGLRWKRHRNLDTNLHHQMGFWIALPLFVLSLTGVWISFPQLFAGFDGAQRGPDRAAMARARPLAMPAIPLDRALLNAGAALRGPVRSIDWPTDRAPRWTIAADQGAISVDARGGTVKTVEDKRPPRTTIARLMRQVHDGSDMGLLWQLIIFLGGLIPAALAVTGIIMWWRARTWRGDLAARKRAGA